MATAYPIRKKTLPRLSEAKYRKGEHTTGNAPYGYLLEEKQLVVNPFAPSINSLFAESAASSGMLLSSGFWLAFILVSVIPCKKKRRKKAVKPADDAEPEADFDGEPPVTMARLMEHTDGYDNRLEEDYQNGWDKNDPSWQCGCGKWNTGNFIDMV